MKLLVFFFIASVIALAQSGGLLDVSTGNRCTAVFTPATAATDVQLDCQTAGKPVLSGKVNLAAITGLTSGAIIMYITGANERVSLLFKRPTAAALLHVEAAVNDVLVTSKDVVVP